MFMATMAMDTAAKGSKVFALCLPLLLNVEVIASEFEFSPAIGIEETYSDNVLALSQDKKSSLVSDTFVKLDSNYKSKVVDFSFNSSSSYIFYSHDHNLDQAYHTLDTSLQISPWTYAPSLVFTTNISNVASNSVDNQFADIISSNTVQLENYQASLVEQIENNDFSFNSNVSVFKVATEDNRGESEGYSANLGFSNGKNINYVFWDISGSYFDRKNDNRSGRNYNVEAKIGFNTPIKLSPYYRYFDEDYSGNIANNARSTTASRGAGIRWQLARHFLLDVSYNFVEDNRLSDDYVEATIDWKPSERTSIYASYNQRFFGDSFDVNISHKSRRLTNTLTYNESLQAFERDSFETIVTGSIFCPLGQAFDRDTCLDQLDDSQDPTNFIELDLLGLNPIEDDEFSLNKVLAWNSELSLPRTTFNLQVSKRERESLTRGNVDKYFDTSLTATRKVSPKSNLALSFRFNHVDYNSNAINDLITRSDYYRNLRLTYDRTIAKTIEGDVNIEYRNRSAERSDRDYEEVRLSFSLEKKF